MVLFVPAPHHQPCMILDESNTPSQAFVVENWGGVYIHSTRSPAQRQGSTVLGVGELGPSCGAFLTFLCSTLGLRHAEGHAEGGIEPLETAGSLTLGWDRRTGIAGWEVDTMVRTRLATLFHGTAHPNPMAL